MSVQELDVKPDANTVNEPDNPEHELTEYILYDSALVIVGQDNVTVSSEFNVITGSGAAKAQKIPSSVSPSQSLSLPSQTSALGPT